MSKSTGLSCSPLSITIAVAFDFLEKIGIWCHRRLVEEMRIMDIEAMKREAIENQESTQIQPGRVYPSEVSAADTGTKKPSQEVAKKIAKAAGVKSKSMCLPRHSALATSRFWQDILLG